MPRPSYIIPKQISKIRYMLYLALQGIDHLACRVYGNLRTAGKDFSNNNPQRRPRAFNLMTMEALEMRRIPQRRGKGCQLKGIFETNLC